MASYCADAPEQALLSLINNYRAKHGRRPLKLTQTLGAAAEHHSTDIAANNVFSHTLSDGTSWSQNMTNHGYTDSTARAENIAAGHADASSTFNRWKNGSAHNANMLSAIFTAIGIGRAYGADSTHKWYWTADFGGVADGAARLC